MNKTMTIRINNETVKTPAESMTVREVLEWRHVPDGGTAVALNDRLVPRAKWDSTYISMDDNLTIISAAFGG